MTPFSKGGGWSWPDELDVRFDGPTAIVTSLAPGRHSPDIRALTILEGAENGALVAAGDVTALRLELGNAWSGSEELRRLALRVGVLGANGIPIRVMLGGEHLSAPDPFCGNADGLTTDSHDFGLTVEDSGLGLELVSRAMDRWIEETTGRIRRFLDEEGEDRDGPTLPVVLLLPEDDHLHSRAPRLCTRLREKGIALIINQRARRTGLRDQLIRTGERYKAGVLGLSESGSWRGNEYEHLLPVGSEHLGIWAPLQAGLDQDLPREDWHAMFCSLNSSQAFGYNLVAGLRRVGLLDRALENVDGLPAGSMDIEQVAFEFGPPEMRAALGETSERHTQIDCVVWWRDRGSNSRQAILFEVKLTESEFGACRGPLSDDNHRKDVCAKADDQTRLAHCYLRVPPHARTYLERRRDYRELAERLAVDGQCPLAGPGYQLARNLIARAWLAGDAPPEYRAQTARLFVLSASATPALSSGRLRVLGSTPADRLRALGVGWIDARLLVESVASSPDAAPLLEYLQARYAPIFNVP